jgi:putative hydrolase of the HAD superfamily
MPGVMKEIRGKGNLRPKDESPKQEFPVIERRSIVFDLFHTLVDPEAFRPGDHRRTEIVADLIGVNPQAFLSYWTNTLPTRLTSSKTVLQFLEEYYLTQTGKRCPRDKLERADYELGRYQDIAILRPRPDVVAALRALRSKGVKLGLLSNCDEREFREWSHSLLAPLFDTVCTSYSIGYAKPSVRAYEIALSMLEMKASRSIFVGDGGSGELEGAKEAGFGQVVFMKGFVSKNGLRTPRELALLQQTADTSIDSLEELVLLVESS